MRDSKSCVIATRGLDPRGSNLGQRKRDVTRRLLRRFALRNDGANQSELTE
jgi:hypothetical protein